MYIAVFTPNYPPETGACAERIRYLAERLQQDGWHVEIFTLLPNYPKGEIAEAYRGRLYVREQRENITVHRCFSLPMHHRSLMLRLVGMCMASLVALGAALRFMRGKPDIVFVQSPPLLPVLSAWFVSAFFRTRFVINLSDLWPRALFDLGIVKRGRLYKCLAALEGFLLRRADGLIGQSGEICTYIRRRICGAQPLLYRTGVDTSRFVSRGATQQPTQPLRIVYAGLLGMAQGIFALCRAVNFAELGCELHIYGDGFERLPLAAWLSANAERGIVLHTPLPPSALPNILSGYDAALIAQQNAVTGTVPSKLYEAMAAGLPVLLMGAGESAAIVRQANAGWVMPPADYAALRRCITEVQTHTTEQLLCIGQRGQDFARIHFDRAMYFDALQSFLKCML